VNVIRGILLSLALCSICFGASPPGTPPSFTIAVSGVSGQADGDYSFDFDDQAGVWAFTSGPVPMIGDIGFDEGSVTDGSSNGFETSGMGASGPLSIDGFGIYSGGSFSSSVPEVGTGAAIAFFLIPFFLRSRAGPSELTGPLCSSWR